MKTAIITSLFIIGLIIQYDKSDSVNNNTLTNRDTSINNCIIIGNEEQTTYCLGDVSAKIIHARDELPQVILLNKTSNLSLKMYKCPGDGRNEFKYFIISQDTSMPKIEYSAKPNNPGLIHTDYEDFITENDIKVGVTKNFIIKNKGKEYSSEKHDSLEIISYSDINLYEAKYYFKNDTLTRFEFGFVYP